MKVFIDTCVLIPEMTRELVIGFARAGRFEPIWSGDVLDEWRGVAKRERQVPPEAVIDRLAGEFPAALVSHSPRTLMSLSLPDESDVVILAAAIDAGAEELLTFNLRDFPSRALARHNVIRRHPDEFLVEQFNVDPEIGRSIMENALREARERDQDVSNPRKTLKRSLLPRLGKALYPS